MRATLCATTSVEDWNTIRASFVELYGSDVVSTYVDASLLIRHAKFMPLGMNNAERNMALRIRRALLDQYSVDEYIKLYLTADEEGKYSFPLWLVHELMKYTVIVHGEITQVD